nr:hypothetical protein [Planomonospora sp. ID82291]
MYAVVVEVLAAPAQGLNTQGLADWLRSFFAPLFLVMVSVVALFFLFTREITRFAQFLAISILIGLVFYFPGIVEVLARGVADALGVSG